MIGFELLCYCGVIVSVVLTVYVIVTVIDTVVDWFRKRY